MGNKINKASTTPTGSKRKRAAKTWYEQPAKKKARTSRTADTDADTVSTISDDTTVATVTTPQTATFRLLPIIVKRDPNKVGFSDFPGELRNHVYEYTVLGSKDDPIRITSGMDGKHPPPTPNHCHTLS